MELTYKCTGFNLLTPFEIYDILKLRIEVFVIEQNCLYQDLDDKDKFCEHLIGVNKDGEIMSYARIVPKGISYNDYVSIGRVIVSQKARGTQEGYNLMSRAIKICNTNWPRSPIKISAQAHLQNFYGKCGFKAVGSLYLEDEIPHIAMVRN